MKKVIFLGSGGHFKVCLSGLMNSSLSSGVIPLGVVGPALDINSGILEFLDDSGLVYLGDDSVIHEYDPQSVILVNCLGTADYNTSGTESALPLRARLFGQMKSAGYTFLSLKHDFSFADQGSQLGEGSQIMAGAVVQPSCIIGENSIINTSASIDHDSFIGAHTHIAPGAVLCGGVTIGSCVLIGSGARILPGMSVGDHAVVGAGSVVTRDVADNIMVKGVPAI